MVFEQDRPLDFIYLAVNNAFEPLTGLKNVVGKKASEVMPGIQETEPGTFRDLRQGSPDRQAGEV